MNITNITVKKIEGQKVLRGVASVVFDDQLKVREIKILEKEDKGLYIMMPNKKIGEDKYLRLYHSRYSEGYRYPCSFYLRCGFGQKD